MHGQPPAARGAGLWRADRVARSPVVPGGSCRPRGLRRGRCARPGGQCRGPAGLPATRAGGRLVSTTVVLVASRRRRGRRRGTRLRDGRGRYGLRYLATACSRLLLVLQQSATHPRLLGCLSPVRAAGCQPAGRAAVCGGASLRHHRAITAAASAKWPTGCQRGRPLIGMAAPPKVSLRSAGAWAA